jgi:hypothetical protein
MTIHLKPEIEALINQLMSSSSEPFKCSTKKKLCCPMTGR